MEYTIKGPYKNLQEMYEAQKSKETQEFPKLSFLGMKIRDRLELVSDQSILGFSIRLALNSGKSNAVIFKTIADAYHDSPEVALDVVDQETIDLIHKALNVSQ
jgi:hypothetical protein